MSGFVYCDNVVVSENLKAGPTSVVFSTMSSGMTFVIIVPDNKEAINIKAPLKSGWSWDTEYESGCGQDHMFNYSSNEFRAPADAFTDHVKGEIRSCEGEGDDIIADIPEFDYILKAGSIKIVPEKSVAGLGEFVKVEALNYYPDIDETGSLVDMLNWHSDVNTTISDERNGEPLGMLYSPLSTIYVTSDIAGLETVYATPGGDSPNEDANISFFDFDFIVEPVVGEFDDDFGDNVLIDSRNAVVTITTSPDWIDTSDARFVMIAYPKETGNLINNNVGTEITFTETEDPKIWNTSKTYWYGKSPNKLCYNNGVEYVFAVRVVGSSHEVLKNCIIKFPDSGPGVRAVVPTASNSVIHDPEVVPGIPISYRCLIEFKDFPKEAIPYGLPTTDQYFDLTEKEELFHAKQFLGEVPSNQGGQGDLFTAEGIQYNLNWVGAGPWYVYGSTPEETLNVAEAVLNDGEDKEHTMSDNLWTLDRGFVELRAKEHTGYNAAFTYDCTYLAEFGPNPENISHPAH